MSSQPGPQPMGMPGGGVPPGTAGLGARFLARLLDGLIVFIPASIVLALLDCRDRAAWEGWTAGHGAR